MQGSAQTVGTRVGTIYGVLLNDRASVERRRETFLAAPYKAPPIAPILYIKPRNTFAAHGAAVGVPNDPGTVRIDATIGAVIGRTASQVAIDDALSFVSGYAIVSDVTLPHDSVYRPAVRHRCRDGYCPVGAVSAADGFDIAKAMITVVIGGTVVHRRTLSDLVRTLPQLLVDITAFMTLEAGDMLLLGAPDDMPLARPGDDVRIEVPGLVTLAHTVVAEAAA